VSDTDTTPLLPWPNACIAMHALMTPANINPPINLPCVLSSRQSSACTSADSPPGSPHHQHGTTLPARTLNTCTTSAVHPEPTLPHAPPPQARVRQAGGAIVCNRGCQRVMGMLLATRSIGDFDLRAYGVIPDPELNCYRRCPEDEFMVMASDGLWDVVQCHEACALVAKVFQRGRCKGMSRRATCRWGQLWAACWQLLRGRQWDEFVLKHSCTLA
jgi:hypothetical protein